MKYKLITAVVIALVMLPITIQAQPAPDPEPDTGQFYSVGVGANIILDTIIIDLPGIYDDTLLLILHFPDPSNPADTLLMLEAGYRRAGLGWTVLFKQGELEGAGYLPDYDAPTVIYTVDPLYQMDANQDGRVNLGDAMKLVEYIFFTPEE